MGAYLGMMSLFPSGHLIPEVASSREQNDSNPVPLSLYSPANGANVQPYRWGCGLAARILRRAGLGGLVLPFVRSFVSIRTEGLENLEQLSGPSIFAATHESELDALVILAALPARWRYRTAVSMADWVFWGEWFGGPKLQTLRYGLRVALFNGFTLPPGRAALRRSFRHMEFLARNGWSILFFPEGAHTSRLLPFQPGVGLAASRLQMPVIPIFVKGMGVILPHGSHIARPGRALVRFGKPIHPDGGDFRELTGRIEQQVRSLDIP
jgi:1-acyl-sn-glycerol-3-phosphate acyltransferase